MSTIQQKIDELVECGNSYFDKKSLIESLVEYSRALDLFDLLEKYYKVQKHEILVRCAVCYDLLGNSIKAENFIDKALDIIPNLSFLLLYKSVLLLVNGQTEKANIMLIKYKQISMGKNSLIYETFKLLYYYIMELDHPVLLKEINETVSNYKTNSILLLLRASVNLKLFYLKYPNQISGKDEFVSFTTDSKLTVNDINAFNYTNSTFNKVSPSNIQSNPCSNNNTPQNKNNSNIESPDLTKLKESDQNYIQFKQDLDEINNNEPKETAEFLLREGISIDTLTKLFFLSIPEMEEVEPKKLIQYKTLFSGMKIFYVLFKAVKLLKVKIQKKRLKKEYSYQLQQLKSLPTGSNSANLNAIDEVNFANLSNITKYNPNNQTNFSIIKEINANIRSEYEDKVISLYSSAFFSNINLTRKELETNSSINLGSLGIFSNANLSKKGSEGSNNNSAIAQQNNQEDEEKVNLRSQSYNKAIQEKIYQNFFFKNKFYCHSNLNKRIIKNYNKANIAESLLFKTNQTYSNNSNSINCKRSNKGKQNQNSGVGKSGNVNSTNMVSGINVTTNNNSNNINENVPNLGSFLENVKIYSKDNKNIMIENNQEKVNFLFKELSIFDSNNITGNDYLNASVKRKNRTNNSDFNDETINRNTFSSSKIVQNNNKQHYSLNNSGQQNQTNLSGNLKKNNSTLEMKCEVIKDVKSNLTRIPINKLMFSNSSSSNNKINDSNLTDRKSVIQMHEKSFKGLNCNELINSEEKLEMQDTSQSISIINNIRNDLSKPNKK